MKKHSCSYCKHMVKEKKDEKKKTQKTPKGDKAHKKITKVMREYKHGELHSGSKKGPKVKSRRQAIAIALSEGRRAKK